MSNSRKPLISLANKTLRKTQEFHQDFTGVDADHRATLMSRQETSMNGKQSQPEFQGHTQDQGRAPGDGVEARRGVRDAPPPPN